MPFDHLVHWVPDLEAAMEQYRALGFQPVYGGQHQGRGTHDALCHLGLAYIELLAVNNWDFVRDWQPLGFSRIEAAIQAGGGAMDFVVEVTDVPATVAKARANGIRMSDPTPRSRQWPDGSTASWVSSRFLEGPAWRPSYIQWELPPVRRRADLQARGVLTSPQDHWTLDHLVVETDDPPADARWLSRTLSLPAALPGPEGLMVRLPGCNVVLTRGPADRITRVVFARPGTPVGEVAGLQLTCKET